jgi:hypothetical protein
MQIQRVMSKLSFSNFAVTLESLPDCKNMNVHEQTFSNFCETKFVNIYTHKKNVFSIAPFLEMTYVETIHL